MPRSGERKEQGRSSDDHGDIRSADLKFGDTIPEIPLTGLMRQSAAVILTLISLRISKAQDSLPVVFEQDPSRNASIAIIHARGGGIRLRQRSRKGLLPQGSYDAESHGSNGCQRLFLVLTPNNPFVTITDERRQRKSHTIATECPPAFIELLRTAR